MNRLALLTLAATMLVPAGALAQTVTPPPEEDTPKTGLNVPAKKPAPKATPTPTPAPTAAPAPVATTRPAPAPAPKAAPAPAPTPRAGVSWQGQQAAPAPRAAPPPPPAATVKARPVAPVMPPPARVEVRRAPPPPAPAAPMRQEGHGAMHGKKQHGDAGMHGRKHDGPARVIVRRRPGEAQVAPPADRFVIRREPMHDDGGYYGHGSYRRLERGHRVPGYWAGPGFHIRDFGRYGLHQPMHGGRWVRYYDDALLIDPYGNVHDGRWGMKWDEYGDEWSHDERGIPVYAGDGDYHPGEEDYAWVEGEDGYAGGHGGGHPYQGMHQGGYYGGGYPAYYGGCNCGGMITETITTTTTAPTVTQKVWYEEVPRASKRLRR